MFCGSRPGACRGSTSVVSVNQGIVGVCAAVLSVPCIMLLYIERRDAGAMFTNEVRAKQRPDQTWMAHVRHHQVPAGLTREEAQRRPNEPHIGVVVGS